MKTPEIFTGDASGFESSFGLRVMEQEEVSGMEGEADLHVIQAAVQIGCWQIGQGLLGLWMVVGACFRSPKIINTERGIIGAIFEKEKKSIIAPTSLGNLSQRKPPYVPQAGDQALNSITQGTQDGLLPYCHRPSNFFSSQTQSLGV